MKNLMRIFAVYVSAICVVCLSGCFSGTTVEMDAEINTTRKTNDGKVFYAVIRTDSEKDYVRASYESVYKSFLEYKGGNNIFISPVKENTSKTIEVQAGESISIYFLFSKPGGKAWKYRIKKLDKDQTYTFYLGENYIKKVEVGRGLLSTLM